MEHTMPWGPRAQRVLDQLYAAGEHADAPAVAALHRRAEGSEALDDLALADALRHALLPVSRQAGRFLYLLARSTRAASIVEFGTSFGVSAIYLASALRDNGGGRLVTTELHPHKAAAARTHLAEAGLAKWVEVRQGDARQTLADLAGPFDLVLLDGWKHLYLPVLRLLEPRLRPGTLVVADNLSKFSAELAPYADHVRTGAGYVSMAVPFEDQLELSLRR
jgi:predicted O-methyltransferase YrrM